MSEREVSTKHFNGGNVFGRVEGDIKKETSRGGKEYISFTVNVSGSRCGSVTAYCRMWGEDRVAPFLKALKKNPHGHYWLKGFFGQYWNEQNQVFSNFTIFQFEERASDPRAAFILKGLVDQAQPVKTGQRILMHVAREGAEKENFELWSPDEKLLDLVEPGQLIEAKGYVRQECPEDDFGGSTGPVRAYVEQLRIF